MCCNKKLGFSKWTYCSWMWLTSSWNCCEHHSNQSVFPRIGSWRSKVWRFCRVLSWMLMTSSAGIQCVWIFKSCAVFGWRWMDVELAQNFGKKLGAAWTFRGLDSWQQWRIPTFWHPQAMYTGIFNLCRMSATSGTKSCCLKSGNLSRQFVRCKWIPKTWKKWGAAWTFRGLSFKVTAGNQQFTSHSQCTRKFSICAGCRRHPAQNLAAWSLDKVEPSVVWWKWSPKTSKKNGVRHGHLGDLILSCSRKSTVYQRQSMYKEIFHLCRMSAKSGTKFFEWWRSHARPTWWFLVFVRARSFFGAFTATGWPFLDRQHVFQLVCCNNLVQ